jgi:hypothetical protein
LDLFTKLDRNKNGVLDKMEMKKAAKYMHSFMPPQARWRWAEMDTDGDGTISLAEWLAFLGAKADLGDFGEGELLAAITRWCEHEAGLEKEAEAARKVAEAWEKNHGERIVRDRSAHEHEEKLHRIALEYGRYHGIPPPDGATYLDMGPDIYLDKDGNYTDEARWLLDLRSDMGVTSANFESHFFPQFFGLRWSPEAAAEVDDKISIARGGR